MSAGGLRADCEQCCGLCCVAPPFDAEQGFGHSKLAHVPCPNLRVDFRCAIHAELRTQGFAACAAFECYGAGQRVTQQLFGGKSWRSSPELAEQMFSAYLRYRALHELMAMLALAIDRVSPSKRSLLAEHLQRLDDLCASGEALNPVVRIAPMRRELESLLRRLLRGAGAELREPTETSSPPRSSPDSDDCRPR